MRPFALSLTAARADGYELAERLGFDELREALSVSVFDREDGRVAVEALYASREDAEQARQMLPPGVDATVAQLPDEDWVARSQSGLAPIHAGRFLVHGSHDAPDTTGRVPILVDAGAAFGTGHHGTTRGCLLMLDTLAGKPSPARILDLGTGAGILAIAAAKIFPEADILATDIDPEAVAVARTNAELNGVSFRCVAAEGFDTPALRGARFDLVLANILAGPLQGMAPDIASALAPGGTAVLSGILDAQADTVADTFAAHGLRTKKRPSLDGWTSLWAQAPSG